MSRTKKTTINTFVASLLIWIRELFNMIIFILIAFLLFNVAKLTLGYESLTQYDDYIKISIIVLAYIGIFLGAHNAFKSINKKSLHIAKGAKYVVIIYQVILIAGFSYICYLNKYDVKLFLGGYLSIYWQFFLNTIYTYVNNKNYPIENKKSNDGNYDRIITNKDGLIIDVEKLK